MSSLEKNQPDLSTVLPIDSPIDLSMNLSASQHHVSPNINDTSLLHNQSTHTINTPPNNVGLYPNAKKMNQEYFVTNFHNSVTPEQLLNYIEEHGNVDRSDIRVFRLTRLGQDITKLAYISYKIETTKEIANIILSNDFWPNLCQIKKFIRKTGNRLIDQQYNKQRNVVSPLNLISHRDSNILSEHSQHSQHPQHFHHKRQN